MIRTILLLLVIVGLLTVLVMSVTACGPPCTGHGGIKDYLGHGMYFCNDGTKEIA